MYNFSELEASVEFCYCNTYSCQQNVNMHRYNACKEKRQGFDFNFLFTVKNYWYWQIFKSLGPQHTNIFIAKLVTKLVCRGIKSSPWGFV